MRRTKSRVELDRDIEDALAGAGGQVGHWPAIPTETRDVPAWSRTTKKPAVTGVARTRPSPPSPLSVVLAAVRAAPASARYGPADVFIYPLWRKVKGKLGMSLEQFKRWLVDENREQHLTLMRADMVDDMNPELVEKSEISDLGAQFHFVLDEEARRRRGW